MNGSIPLSWGDRGQDLGLLEQLESVGLEKGALHRGGFPSK